MAYSSSPVWKIVLCLVQRFYQIPTPWRSCLARGGISIYGLLVIPSMEDCALFGSTILPNTDSVAFLFGKRRYQHLWLTRHPQYGRLCFVWFNDSTKYRLRGVLVWQEAVSASMAYSSSPVWKIVLCLVQRFYQIPTP